VATAEGLHRLFELLPLDQAMSHLLATTTGPEEARAWVTNSQATPAVKAALWLYVDDLEKAHGIVQDLHNPSGSFIHAIVHRREGDYPNSKYWYSQAGRHPVIGALAGYQPYSFVDQAQKAGAANPPDLVDLQRAEWKAIFDYVVQEGI
jgi:hypothetical protein